MMIPELPRIASNPLLALVVAVSLMAPGVHAQKDTLKQGDKAPIPNLGSDIQVISGPMPGPFKEGDTYVIEFWATWCAPCRASIPHINKLYKTFKTEGLHVWGVSNEEPSKIRNYVARKGDGMSYTVISDQSGAIEKAYMSAAGQKGIPTAFVVGPSGRVVYIGHPMAPGFDRAIKLCTSGKYDPVMEEQAKPFMENLEKATNANDWRMAHRQLDGLLALDPWIFSDEIFTKYQIYLQGQNDPETANEFMMTQITETYSTKPDVLEDIIYNLLTDPDMQAADPQLKVKAIEVLGESMGAENPRYLSLLALNSHKEGDLRAAVDLQYQAYMGAAGPDRERMRSVLDAYKAEQSRREGTSSRGGRQRR